MMPESGWLLSYGISGVLACFVAAIVARQFSDEQTPRGRVYLIGMFIGCLAALAASPWLIWWVLAIDDSATFTKGGGVCLAMFFTIGGGVIGGIAGLFGLPAFIEFLYWYFRLPKPKWTRPEDV